MSEVTITDKVVQRFWTKVDKDGEWFEDMDSPCWKWIGCTDSNGYGQQRINGKIIGAHRLSYILEYGDIPIGMVIDHQCNNPNCVNPLHMKLSSRAANSWRGNKFLFCHRGHPLTEENLWYESNGRRHCKECLKLQHRQWYAKSKLEVE